MNREKISVALATFNEKQNITPCLASVKNLADEIVIVDGKSSDKTAQIAKKLGARVISTTNKAMFHINKNLAIANCKNEWILLLDADERITEELAQEILATIGQNPKANGFWLNRRNWFLGGFLKKGGAYPDSVIRLFRKGKGRLLEVSVHEQVSIDGDVGHLKNDLLHLADPSFSRYLSRADRYTNETAQQIRVKNPGSSVWVLVYYALIKPFSVFVSIYIRHRGYVDGFRGFTWALFSAAHYFYAYVKYLEKTQNKIK